MQPSDAESLIDAAVPRHSGVWADLGAGEGTFTRALANLLEPGSRIYAVDRDKSALSWIDRAQSSDKAQIVPVVDDFSRAFDIAESVKTLLDGMLFANSLHFVADQSAVLARLTGWLRPGGRVVLVEYDQRGPNRWVPYPIPVESLRTLAQVAGLTDPIVTATRPSEYQGVLYAAAMDKPAPARLRGNDAPDV